ncbi:DNA replication regulator family [hydrothermal vent metagenome]|uniref:DNA replication regulator family n=1 Tax=hydrothermal vent metagenome TaxID=652676 RepID=A0A1W1C3V3_9ZZZZ
MQKLLKWTLETIREEDSSFSWMEEYRFEWAPLVQNAVSQSIEGKTVLILTDESRKWFGSYILYAINSLSKNRPLFPVYQLSKSFPHFSLLRSKEDLQLLEDMLDISYPNGYYIWYIGRSDHPHTKLTFRKENSFIWAFDEEVANAFSLRSSDPLLDIKLLQLYKLFDATLSATLFGELDLEL